MPRFKHIFLVLIAIALMAPVAHAQTHDEHGAPAKAKPQGMEMQKPMGPGMAMGMHGGMNAQLTPEKQALLDKLTADHSQKVEPLQKQLRAKHAMLEALLLEEKIDDKKVDGIVKDINEVQAKIFAEKISLKKQLIKNDLPLGAGMMMGGMHGGMMGGGMMGKGMKCPMMSKPSMEEDAKN